jgi:hypothetical protein
MERAKHELNQREYLQYEVQYMRSANTNLTNAGAKARARHIENCTRPFVAPKHAGLGALSLASIIFILREVKSGVSTAQTKTSSRITQTSETSQSNRNRNANPKHCGDLCID